MNQPVRTAHLQLNLPLLNAPATVLPDNKERELVAALVELLVNAARESAGHLVNGGVDESQADS